MIRRSALASLVVAAALCTAAAADDAPAPGAADVPDWAALSREEAAAQAFHLIYQRFGRLQLTPDSRVDDFLDTEPGIRAAAWDAVHRRADVSRPQVYSDGVVAVQVHVPIELIIAQLKSVCASHYAGQKHRPEDFDRIPLYTDRRGLWAAAAVRRGLDHPVQVIGQRRVAGVQPDLVGTGVQGGQRQAGVEVDVGHQRDVRPVADGPATESLCDFAVTGDTAMRRPAGGFTLIEMLLVISIIALLMAVLVPQIGAVVQAVKVKDTEHRIGVIHAVVEDYGRVYGAYPLSTSPNPNMKATDSDAYPFYTYPSGEKASYIFHHGTNLLHPFGGKFLVYFLMGPNGMGWHRPKNPSNASDPAYCNRFLSAEWDAPDGLSPYLRNSGCGGDSGDYPAPCFVDAFGIEGRGGGLIGYAAGNPRASGITKWRKDYLGHTNDAFTAIYYWNCRKYSGSWGDGRGTEHRDRMFGQCPYDFVLLSAGPDHLLGWRVYGMEYGGEFRKGSYADFDHGITNDIANFPIK